MILFRPKTLLADLQIRSSWEIRNAEPTAEGGARAIAPVNRINPRTGKPVLIYTCSKCGGRCEKLSGAKCWGCFKLKRAGIEPVHDSFFDNEPEIEAVA